MNQSPAIERWFGQAVQRFRHRLQISQEASAERAGLDRSYIGHVERGALNMSLATIDKLARALGVSACTLLSGPAVVPPREPRSEGTADCIGTGCIGRHALDILVVEDDPSDVKLTLRAFKRAGITNSVQVVSDGAEALDLLHCRGRYAHRRGVYRPGLVLLDLNLPKVGGMTVLRRMKADPRTRGIPVVVLTISRKGDDVAEAMGLGAEACIAKPVVFQRLSEVTPKLRLRWALLGAAAGVRV